MPALRKSLFTAVLHYSYCKVCGGIGSVSEWVKCECFDGCEKCNGLMEIEASVCDCRFCKGVQETAVEQVVAESAEEAARLLRKILSKKIAKNESLELVAFSQFGDYKNTFGMDYIGKNFSAECYLVKTTLS